MDWSSREMVDMFSCLEDEGDIVGEGEIDDVEKEPAREVSFAFSTCRAH